MTRKSLIPIAAVFGLLIVVAWYAGAFKNKIMPGSESPEVNSSLELHQVNLTSFQDWESVPATIKAKQATVISSRLLAGINEVNVRAGDKVIKGQVLLQMESADLESRTAQASASINSVEARLKEAELNLTRAINLIERKLLAKVDLDRAQASRDALQAELAQAEERLIEAQSTESYATIMAPIDGVVVDRFVEPGDTAQPGLNLLSIYNPLTLRVEANVREKLALALKLGQALEVIIPSLKIRLDAEIEEIVPAANTASRSFLIKSRLVANRALRPGVYAKLMIPLQMSELILIPGNRIARVGQLNIVWVVENSISERRFIKLGRSFPDDQYEVISGLTAGEMLLPIQNEK
ncbi:MAG: efflux RND transporter periplasmic adaptor subunit [Pseudomonadales bacterium]|nr:efflux RND transporter periplasmic adaptor subunit [Pseudomonadales bacterium]